MTKPSDPPANQLAQATHQASDEQVSVSLGLREMLLLRIGELTIFFMFMDLVPLWQSLLWLGMTWVCNIGVWWYRRSPRFAHHSVELRLRVIRRFAACDAISAGSAGWLLYVPDSVAVHVLLQACLIVVAVMWVMERPHQSKVAGLGAAVIALPVIFSPWLWSSDQTRISAILGFGQMVVVALLWLFAVKQERTYLLQVQLRQTAEDALAVARAAMASKQAFFSAAGHDLRQPVHAFGLYLSSLSRAERALCPPGVVSAWDGMGHAWSALDSLLTQIMDLARLDGAVVAAHTKPTLLLPLLESLVAQFAPVAMAASIRLVRLRQHEHACVLSDPTHVRRIVSNLLANALQHCPPDSTVVLCVRPRGNDWVIRLMDSGPGIDSADQVRIFDEFVQLNNPQRQREGGYGLGLSVSQRFAALLGTSIRVQSALGRGSTFELALPKCPELDAHHESQVAAAAPTVPPRNEPDAESALAMPDMARLVALTSDLGRGVLLVEDDALVAQAMLRFLSGAGVMAWHVDTLAAALDVKHELAVVVCDLRLKASPSEFAALGLAAATEPEFLQWPGLYLAHYFQSRGVGALVVTGENPMLWAPLAEQLGVAALSKPLTSQQLYRALVGAIEKSI